MGSSSQHASALTASNAFISALGQSFATLKNLFRTHFEPKPVYLETASQKLAALPLVVYGSTAGKATHHARLVASFVHTSSFSMNRLTMKEIKARKTVIFCCSTCGDAEFPANAQRFAAQLAACKEDFSDVGFAVLALGRREARSFAAAGKSIHEMMLERGAKPLLPVCCLDSSAPDGDDGKYADWSRELATALYLRKPKMGMEAVNSVEECDSADLRPVRPIGFEFVTVAEISLLSEEGEVPALRKVVIDLPDGLTYDAGDLFGVLPCNPDSVVGEVLTALKLTPSAGFSVSGDAVIPGRLSVQNLFSQFLDLGGIPPRAVFAAFAAVANDEGKQKLAPLINEKDRSAYMAYIEDISIAECICQFAQFGVPSLETLVSTIPHMKPRFYSITSLPCTRPGRLEICVMEVFFGKGNKRAGISSNFIAGRGGKTLAMMIRGSPFKYPKDMTVPVIMVALGSGIAAMLSMLAVRAKTEGTLGPCVLILGTRYQGSFPYLVKELHDMEKSKIITKFFHVASRDGPKPMHVQQCLKENAEILWQYWEDYRTPFYYCGPQRDIPGELQQIMLNITISEGWLSIEEAMAFSNRHTWVISES
jgi:sulfite reductase (NADPH) flavoprotein alpha-component